MKLGKLLSHGMTKTADDLTGAAKLIKVSSTYCLKRRSMVLSAGAGLIAMPSFFSSAQGQEAVKMRLSWWGSDDRHERTLKLIKLWESRHPGVSMTAQYGGFIGYQDKLSTEFAGRNAPDVMQIAENRETLAGSGRLLQLDEYIARGELDLTYANKGVLESLKINGKLYSIPWGLATGCWFLDTKVFADTQVDLPKANWTWEAYAEKAKAISKASPKGLYGSADIWAPAGTRALAAFEVFLRGRGKTAFTDSGNLGFSKDELAEWFNFWDDLRKAGAVPPAEVTALETGFETSPIVTRRVAMYPINSSIASSLQGLAKNKLVIAPFPTGVGSKQLSGKQYGAFINSSMQVYVNADSKNKKLAINFVNAITNDPEIAKIQLMSRGVPASSKMAALVSPGISEIERSMVDMVLYTQQNASTTLFVAWPKTGGQIHDLMQRSHQRIAFGQSNVTQAVANFFDESRQIIN